MSSILKPKTDTNVKNVGLAASLSGDSSAAKNISAAEAHARARADREAIKNLSKIRHQAAEEILDKNGEGVVLEVNEIRTVQSNKNLKKTRKAVIVRDNKERGPRSTIAKTLNLFSFVAVGLVGVLLGIFGGNMYIASKTLVTSLPSEENYIADYAKIYSTYYGKKKPNDRDVEAANVYALAEYLTILDSPVVLDSYSIVGDGYVKAKVSGIVQNQSIGKYISKNGNNYVAESVTDGLIPAAEKLVANLEENTIASYITKKVAGTPPSATYNDTATKTYNLDTDYSAFRSEYGISPYVNLPYLVSTKTVDSASPCTTSVGESGTLYTYKITLNNTYGIINYAPYMMHVSGLKRIPTFYELSLTFTVDESYKFQSIYVYERYQIYYLGLPAECTAETTYTYSY